MKFYKDNPINDYYWCKIYINKLNAVLIDYNNCLRFYENGKYNNTKNAAYIYDKYKEFFLNGLSCGCQNDFTKKTWRRFVKMQKFL